MCAADNCPAWVAEVIALAIMAGIVLGAMITTGVV